jgi:hypothetical protein
MKFLKPLFLLFIFCVSSCFAESFKFVAYGDMPYKIPDDFSRYEKLIRVINQSKPAFTLFVGDTKSGSTPCTDEYNLVVKNYFNQFNSPLIYSIGDNEWTDCHRPLAGGYDPLERLEKLRQYFFKDRLSFGKKSMLLYRQADVMKEYSTYVENSYWIKNDFIFVSIHIPGSNNNLGRTKEAVEEYLTRNSANLAWIDYCFRLAETKHVKGIVFGFQADMFQEKKLAKEPTSGFKDTIESLSSHAQAFKKPVLLINGDSHRLLIDQPLKTTNSKFVLENVLRLQVMGEDQVEAVEVEVNPSSKQPFTFKPILIPENNNY